jgi:hypothetical protein
MQPVLHHPLRHIIDARGCPVLKICSKTEEFTAQLVCLWHNVMDDNLYKSVNWMQRSASAY